MDTKSKNRLRASFILLLVFIIAISFVATLMCQEAANAAEAELDEAIAAGTIESGDKYEFRFLFELAGGNMTFLLTLMLSALFGIVLGIVSGGDGILSKKPVSIFPPEFIVAAYFILYITYYIVMSFSAGFARGGTLAPVFALWLLVSCIAVWGVLLVMPLFFKKLRPDFLHRSLIRKLLSLLKKLYLKFDRWLEIFLTTKLSSGWLLALFILLGAAALFAAISGDTLIVYWFILLLVYLPLRRIGKKLKRDYAVMLDGLTQMSTGNLDVTIDGDLGYFEPLKEKTLCIRDGLKTAVEEERKSQNMRTELITNVSHDLRTPLTSIITYVDILKNADLPEEERQKCVEVLTAKSQRLKALIDDLFEISKASSNNIKVEPEDMDFTSFIRQFRLEYEDRTEASGLSFRFELPEYALPVRLDGRLTYRVVENLTDNAIKYAAPGSRVYVSVQKAGDYVRFEMKNVSQNELNFDPSEITERFIRGDLSRNTEGSGLGLSIAKSFAEIQGGAFNIEIDGDLFKAIIMWPLRAQ